MLKVNNNVVWKQARNSRYPHSTVGSIWHTSHCRQFCCPFSVTLH